MKNLPVLVLLPESVGWNPADIKKEAFSVLKRWGSIVTAVPLEKRVLKPMPKAQIDSIREEYDEDMISDRTFDEYLAEYGYQQDKNGVWCYCTVDNPKLARYDVGGRFRNMLPVLDGVTDKIESRTTQEMKDSSLMVTENMWKEAIGEDLPRPSFCTAVQLKNIDWKATEDFGERWLDIVLNQINFASSLSMSQMAAFKQGTGPEAKTQVDLFHQSINNFFDFDPLLRDSIFCLSETDERDQQGQRKYRMQMALSNDDFKKLFGDMFRFAPFAICTTDDFHSPDWTDRYGLLEWAARAEELLRTGYPGNMIAVMCEGSPLEESTDEVFFFHQSLATQELVAFFVDRMTTEKLRDNYGKKA